MSFYRVLSEYYQDIFPANPKEKQFLKTHLPGTFSNALDIGCGIGNTVSFLGEYTSEVVGIDLDQNMITQAKERFLHGHFYVCDMREVTTLNEAPFAVITSFGNTLVHIPQDQVALALKQWSTITKPNGYLLIQIINYDRILNNTIKALPIITNDKVTMERIYHHHKNHIEFESILVDHKKQQTYNQSVKLYPVKKDTLCAFVDEAGFDVTYVAGGFDNSPWNQESYATIIIARKRNV
jgi:SAM-dependent methyltransferase